MKNYNFLGYEYSDLDSLANAYAENFDDGIVDIYSNYKKIAKFIKKTTKNESMVDDFLSIITYSKYKNNALTFTIFLFLNTKRVCINSRFIEFKEFIELLKENPNKENNILFAFLEDFGISKTYAQLDSKLALNAYFIDKYAYDDLTYNYLITYYDYEDSLKFETIVKTIAINNEECYKKLVNVLKKQDALLYVAHHYGFKDAIEMKNDVSPVFRAVKILRGELSDEDLKKFILDTFYWWILDKLQYYKAKGKAIEPYNNLKKIKKEYDGYLKDLKLNRIQGISLDFYSELSRRIFINYNNLVYYYKKGDVVVDGGKYQFDAQYCYTYITKDFMSDNIVKLHIPKAEREPRLNPLTGEPIIEDDMDEDEEDFEDNELKLMEDDSNNFVEDIELSKSIMKKNISFAGAINFWTGFNLILVLASTILFGLLKIIPIPKSDVLYNLLNPIAILIIVLAAVGSFVGIVLSIITSALSNKNRTKIYDLNYLITARKKEKLTLDQQLKVIELSEEEPKLIKATTKRYSLIAVLALGFASFSAAMLGVVVIAALNGLVGLLTFKGSATALLLACAAGLVLSLLLFFVKKKRVPYMLFVFLVTIALGFLLAMVM